MRTAARDGGQTSTASLQDAVDALLKMSLLVTADLPAEEALRRSVEEAKLLVGAEVQLLTAPRQGKTTRIHLPNSPLPPPTKVASVFLVDPSRGELFSTINSTGREIRVPIGAGIAGTVAATGAPLLIPDAYADPRFNQVFNSAGFLASEFFFKS